MRRDEQRLQDILEAIDSLTRIVEHRTFDELATDETLRYAVVQRLTVVGEAAARLSSEIKERHGAISWADVVNFRNILVHEYFGLEWPIVWAAATEDAPTLRAQIAEILRSEFPE